mgnify:CR=1 FL=1|jgi:AraC family chitin signaling transcriptional activator
MRNIYLFLCLVLCTASYAQEIPPIQSYSTKDYFGENQNWSISQADDNLIYVANNGGLLEFDGAKWNFYSVPDKSTVRSVKVINGKIYTGSFMDFGFWQKNLFGELIYTSLGKLLDLNFLEDEQFWKIEELDGWLVFQSLSRIYLINTENNKYKIIDSELPITRMYKVNNSIYFQKQNKGIFKIENGDVSLAFDDLIFKENDLVSIFNVNNDLLFLTEDNGFYQIVNETITEWNIDFSVKDLSIYRAIKLKDNSFVLGTISSGIIHLNTDGSLNYKIDYKTGLSNNTVLSIFEDKVNNLWIGLDNGINCINITSRYRLYKDYKGAIGTVYTSYLEDDLLYLGTNQGLFYKKRNEDGDFNLVAGTKGQAWVLKNIDGQLFCGHDDGTFIIENGAIIQTVSTVKGTWDLKIMEDSPNLILQGNYNGLNVLEKANNAWKFRNKLKGFEVSSRFFEQLKSLIFLNHEFKGLYKLEIDDNFNTIKELNAITSIEKGIGSSLLKFSDDYYYSSTNGIFKYTKSNHFEKDKEFSSLFKPYNNVTTLLEVKGSKNKLWRYADDNMLIISPSSVTSKPQVEIIPISRELRNAVPGFENVTQINEAEYLIGTSLGYIILNQINQTNKASFEIKINSANVYEIDNPKIKLDLNKDAVFNNKSNNLEFNYSVPFYKKIINCKYQYQLVGLSEKWSEWQTQSSQIFENLPFGEYTFNVRGKIGNNLTSNIASFNFEIKRPWLLSNTSIAIYILLLILFFFIVHNFYKRYYKKQRQNLLEKANREIKLKELESKQFLSQFNNEKLKIEVESKSRELAVSTMSLIKKNEFLNSIKKEISKLDANNKVKQIIKIINNNLNNTDDWKLFEEAFNNADKDFLKKIKDKHPELTSNDLRLCAYLRLNLSSKEIAPLLNISSRSVEVKRYRLRKKMNLPHESSLTNYIIEL